jgi:hypothetical protein
MHMYTKVPCKSDILSSVNPPHVEIDFHKSPDDSTCYAWSARSATGRRLKNIRAHYVSVKVSTVVRHLLQEAKNIRVHYVSVKVTTVVRRLLLVRT